MSRTLHLLAAPADVGNADMVFALTPIPGVADLTSADRRITYDINAEQATVLADQVGHMARQANLAEVFVKEGLPPVDPFRFCYPQIKPPCRLIVDLLARLENLRVAQPFSAIVYHGPDDWRRLTIESFCTARDGRFAWTPSASPRHLRRDEYGRILRQALWILRDRKHNRGISRGDATTEYLFFAGLTRMMTGVAPVLQKLRASGTPFKVVDMYNDRIEPLTGPLPGGVWRLNGDAVLPPKTHRGDRALRKKIENLPDNPPEGEGVAWRGITLNLVMKPILRDAMITAVSRAQAVNRLLQSNPNALVIGTNENEQVLEVPRATGRDVAVIQTSSLNEYNRVLPGSGRYLVMSNIDVDKLESLGVARNEIVSCGQAYYDTLTRQNAQAEAQALRQRLGIAPERRIFLLADVYAVPGLIEKEPREDTFRAMHRGLARAVREADAILIVKLRPGQSGRALTSNEDLHRQWAREAGIPDDQVIISRESLIFPFIAACDVMISCDSTAGTEAILLDKAMLTWPFSKADHFGYTATGAATRVQSESETEAAMLEILHNPQTRERLAQGRERYRNTYFNTDGDEVAVRQAKALHDAKIAMNKSLSSKSTPE